MPDRRMARRRIGRTAAALALLFALARPAPGLAQLGLPGGSGSQDEPIRIQSDAGIEWQQDQHVYIARGNAVAARGNNEVRADTLIAHYREKPGVKPDGGKPDGGKPDGGKPDSQTGTAAGAVGSLTGEGGGGTEIFRVEAIGNVVLKHEGSTVTGERAVYDIDQGIAVVTGKNLKLTTATDVVTARDSLEWYDAKQIAVARGDAVATRAPKTVKADILTAYMHKSAQPSAKPPFLKQASATQPPAKPPPENGAPHSTAAHGAAGKGALGGGSEGESRISRVDAQGHVIITDALNTGRGDFGVYNADTGIATLIGNVVIQRGANVIQGQRGVMDLNNNVARMMPGGGTGAGEGRTRVQGLLVREKAKPGVSMPVAGFGAERKHP
jgi:lipopolysaccharide export system protein LptA